MRLLIAVILAVLLLAPVASADTTRVDNARAFVQAEDTYGGSMLGFVTYFSGLFFRETATVSVTLMDSGVHRTIKRNALRSSASFRVFVPYYGSAYEPICDFARVRVRTNGKSHTRYFPVCF